MNNGQKEIKQNYKTKTRSNSCINIRRLKELLKLAVDYLVNHYTNATYI
jgi:hypothetical protein